MTKESVQVFHALASFLIFRDLFLMDGLSKEEMDAQYRIDERELSKRFPEEMKNTIHSVGLDGRARILHRSDLI